MSDEEEFNQKVAENTPDITAKEYYLEITEKLSMYMKLRKIKIADLDEKLDCDVQKFFQNSKYFNLNALAAISSELGIRWVFMIGILGFEDSE